MTLSADEQPTPTPTDEFENEVIQPYQQQSPVLVDIEEEKLYNTP